MQGLIGPFVLEHACAELTALLTALEAVVERPHCDWLASHLTGLQSSTAVPARGAAAHMSPLSVRLWSGLQRLVSAGHMEHLQWVPAHCGLPGNEQADALTKEATGLIQQDTPFDARTLAGATARRAKRAGWLAVRKAGTALSWRTASRRAGVVGHQRGGGRLSAPDEPLGMLGTVPSLYRSTSHR